MDKQDHIKYWVDSAENDWITVESLNENGRFVHALFFAHLALEKLCKAHWVKDNPEGYPPKTHNLVYLISQTSLNIIQSQKDFLLLMNDFQLEGRYPDYQQKIFRICDSKKTNEILNEVKKIKSWLISSLQ